MFAFMIFGERSDLGLSRPVPRLPLIGKALTIVNHSTTAIYARLQLDPVRLALEANAERMLMVIETANKTEGADLTGRKHAQEG
jgi:hypothetical protein